MNAESLPVGSVPAMRPRDPWLSTRMFVPPVRSDHVARPRLLERLSQGLSATVLLVSAPSGFGKTTLLSTWLAGAPCPAAWLSLGREDGDLYAFVEHIAVTCSAWPDGLRPGAGSAVLERLQSQSPPPGEVLAALLAGQLAALPGDRLLVLDGYHRADTPAVREFIAALVAAAPPHLHLAIGMRGDLSLPLDGWRQSGQVVEIHADELRFTLAEAHAYLNGAMRLGLDPDTVAVLASRTEGWIAAVQMAALALQPRARGGREDIAQFIQGCAEQDCFLFDYLTEEVLARQPERVRTFMLQTSVLDPLCAELCKAVTGEPGAQALLELLDRLSLFLTPVDAGRSWYRYHPLFAELLRSRLEAGGTDIPALYQRAAAWYAAEGFPGQQL